MFKRDHNVIHVFYAVCLLRTHQDVESVSRGLYLFGPDLRSHTCPVALSQTHAHKPGRTPGQGLQSKGMSKGRSPSKRAEGSRREREREREPTGSKIKAQIAGEERLRGNCFLARGTEGLNTKRRPKRLKEY